MEDLREKLYAHRLSINLIEEVACSEADAEAYRKLLARNQSLPAGVHCNEDVELEYRNFYTIEPCDLTDTERQEFIALEQLSALKSIQKSVKFFVILTIIGLVSWVFFFLIASAL